MAKWLDNRGRRRKDMEEGNKERWSCLNWLLQEACVPEGMCDLEKWKQRGSMCQVKGTV